MLTYQSMFVRYVVCKFEFMKGDNFLHPLFSSCRTVRMNVHPLGHLRVSFASNNPSAVVELVSKVIRCNYVQQKNVFRLGIQPGHLELHLREHLPRRRKNIIMVSLAGAKRVNYVWKFNINVGRFSGTMQRSCLTNSRIIFCSLKPSLRSEVFNFWTLNFIQNCGWLEIIGIIITDQRLCLFVQQMITRILSKLKILTKNYLLDWLHLSQESRLQSRLSQVSPKQSSADQNTSSCQYLI